MADRVDFFFRQRVTEAEFDLAFELIEKADHNLASDLGVFGVIGPRGNFWSHVLESGRCP